MASNFYHQLAAVPAPFALAIIAGTKGSSPQRAGAKALFLPDGKIIGTLGGGCLEAEVQARALKALKTGEAARFEMVLDHDFGWDDGLICGGSVSGVILPHAPRSPELWRRLATVAEPVRWGVKTDFSVAAVPVSPVPEPDGPPSWLYQETVSPPVVLWIAGSGHVAQAVARLAGQLDFSVTVFDDRAELANRNYFPSETRLQVGGWHELLKVTPDSTPAFGVVVTRGHQHDALVLSEWIRFPFAFLGMIGSRRKARIIREQFMRQQIATPEQFDRVACPVGLDIAAVGPQEIAVSVMAQLIQKRAALRDEMKTVRTL
jgi:xanthine dehydrogenase accessory factor